MWYESWKFHQDPLICWEVIGHYLTLCKIYGCCKLWTLKISKPLFLTLSAAYPCYTISYWSNIHLLLWDQLWALVVLVGRTTIKYLKICSSSIFFSTKNGCENHLSLRPCYTKLNDVICCRWPSMVSPWWTLKLICKFQFIYTI